MNGPEHYREAERLLSFVVDSEGDVDSDSELSANILASAQAHATLALAAATAMQAAVDGSEPGMGSGEFHEWYQAAGVKPQKGVDQ